MYTTGEKYYLSCQNCVYVMADFHVIYKSILVHVLYKIDKCLLNWQLQFTKSDTSEKQSVDFMDLKIFASQVINL